MPRIPARIPALVSDYHRSHGSLQAFIRKDLPTFQDFLGPLETLLVVIGHNHPSGVAEPSEADRSITLRLARALALVDIRLLDHLVVSRDGHVSLAERGWI